MKTAINPAVVPAKKKDQAPAVEAAPVAGGDQGEENQDAVATAEPKGEPFIPLPPIETTKATRKGKGEAKPARAAFAALTLGTGKKAEIAEGFGRHLAQAQELAKEPDYVQHALISLLVRIDGKPVTPDEAGDLDLVDYTELLGAIKQVDVTTKPTEAQEDGSRLVYLPMGGTATTVKLKGNHLITAQRMSSKGSEISLALIAVAAKRDGKTLVLEDVMAMRLPDVIKLQEDMQGK